MGVPEARRVKRLVEFLKESEVRLQDLGCHRYPSKIHIFKEQQFIVSQLEAQKLTDSNSVYIRVLIARIRTRYTQGPLNKENPEGYPTLFRRQSKETHRTYVIWAELKDNMARKTYTIPKLLGLRSTRLDNHMSSLLVGKPEYADIVRDSGSESSEGKPLVGCKPTSASVKRKDDSSAESDELLYRGNMNRRSIRQLNQESIREAIREPVRGSFRESIPESFLDGSSQVEWKYRGRSDSETAADEPLSVPSGVPAQRSEGFQRFYKAVISPTHVRVTAGGRIVPNTRGPPSPTSKRTRDPSNIEGQNGSDKLGNGLGKPPVGPVGLAPPLPIIPQFIPGYPPGYQPLQAPMSFVPMAFGPHLSTGLSFAQPPASPATMAQLGVDSTLKDKHNTKPGEIRNENGSTEDKSEKVKITAPEYFDYTKPFFYNGQWMYPFPSPIQAPFQMIGFPPSMAPQLPGRMIMPAATGIGPMMPTATSAGPMMTTAAFTMPHQGAPGSQPVVHRSLSNASPQPPPAPPISSIKPSEITKKQIACFKTSLKYHEDQLQYNRHQIDEKEMETQIRNLQDHIKRFEKTYQDQLEHEKLVLNKDVGSASGASTFATRGTSESDAMVTGTPTNGDMQAPQKSEGNAKDSLTRRTPNNRPLMSSIGGSGNVRYEYPSPETKQPTFAELMEKSGLPSNAALAPIFQPGGYPSSWGGSQPSCDSQEVENRLLVKAGLCRDGRPTYKETRDEVEKRLMTAADWNPYSQGLEKPQSGLRSPNSAPQESSAYSGRPTSNTSDRKGSSHGSTTYFDAPTSTSSGKDHSFGVPYLLGTLPRGANPRTTGDANYVYTRPLTEDETRARYLYWGKAPKSAVKGLPKFDGKHFYPPSPAKEHVSPHRGRTACRVPNNRADIDYDFRGTKSESDPFRPMTPVQKSVVSKAVVVSEEGCGAVRLHRASSFETQIYTGEEDSQVVTEGSDSQLGSGVLASRENSVDTTSIGSLDRRSEKSASKLWQSVLKKGSTSSALSSTTAQGYLPHYSGHAAASLSPSFNKRYVSPPAMTTKASSEYQDIMDGGVLLTPAPEKRGENCPPQAVSALDDQFKNLALDASERHDLAAGFKI
ncbi:hypothetical protein B0H63DRAFT_558964 [Podospora didyma]|uniref:Uncharacterized protein n=1 Tax=Podospora didyma TaxID=330526 RepID=A0AAE0U1J7_9PEZI|nr:hypothetical protein B0H63DRAFT_558964 [Podospora didyma]